MAKLVLEINEELLITNLGLPALESLLPTVRQSITQLKKEAKKKNGKAATLFGAKELKFDFKSILVGAGADSHIVDDWLIVRKKKKASNTETAVKLFLNQVKISGKPINDILRYCIKRDWKGFEAQWIVGTDINVNTPENGFPTNR